MSEGKSQVFSDVTPGQYAKLIEQANDAGIEIAGNSGHVSKLGIEVVWNYSELDRRLELTCLDAPFFLSVDDVNTKLREMVDEALKS